MKKQIDADAARRRLEDLCAKAEHCESELRDKLRAWGISASDSDAIILSLRQNRFVSDHRFAHAYARDKAKFSRWGRRKIAMGLAAKRISPDIAAEALASIPEEDYRGSLLNILLAKCRQHPGILETYEGRVKLYRFGLSRGYESALVSQMIKHICKKDDNDQ